MQACLYKPGFYQSVDFAVLFHPGHCLFLPADWATNRRVSWCVAIISASILNFVRTAIHFSPSSLFVILAACWWVPVICWVLFYKIKPLLLGFLLFSDDLGLHSQLCPCWNHFHPRHWYSFSFPNGFLSFLQFCSTKSNHYCGFRCISLWLLPPFSNLSMLQSITILLVVCLPHFPMVSCHLLITELQNLTIIVGGTVI